MSVRLCSYKLAFLTQWAMFVALTVSLIARFDHWLLWTVILLFGNSGGASPRLLCVPLGRMSPALALSLSYSLSLSCRRSERARIRAESFNEAAHVVAL